MSGPIQPDYVTYDVKAREALLSQVGSLTPVERELFHRITKMWSPEISYSTVLSIMSAESVTAKKDIESLMKKLRSARMGLMTTAILEGNRVPQAVILTNPDDYYFYHKIVEEELMEVVYNLSLNLPSSQSIIEKGITIPSQFISETSYEQLAAIHGQKDIKDYKILKIDAKGPALLLTTQTVKRYVTVALAKMQSYLQNANLMSIVAEIKNMALLEVKKHIESREPTFWTMITKDIIDHQDTIRQNRKVNVDDSFWAIAYFLHNFLFNQLEEVRKRKAADEERAIDMKTIAEQVKAVPTFLMSDERFSELLISFRTKYEKTFAEFKKEFEERFLEAPDRKALPILVHLSRSYMHQDNVHAFFLMNLDKGGRDLFAVYVRQMEQYLKHPNAGEVTAFYSPDNMQNDIFDRIRSIDPMMHELLQRPNLVAEAIILSVKKHKDIKSSDDLKSHLSPFFYPDKIRYRELSVLYGLNVIDIFRIAFMKLSILRQIILKVSGKYESFHKKFDEFLESSYVAPARNTAPKSSLVNEEVAEPIRRKPGSTVKDRSEKSRNPSVAKTAASTGQPELTAQQKQNLKNYSRTEQDSAWKNFGKTLKK